MAIRRRSAGLRIAGGIRLNFYFGVFLELRWLVEVRPNPQSRIPVQAVDRTAPVETVELVDVLVASSSACGQATWPSKQSATAWTVRDLRRSPVEGHHVREGASG
jgi:hypothetical protein